MTKLSVAALALLVSLGICLGKEHESYGRFPIVVEGKHGYIDGMGHVAIQPQFDDAAKFSDGLALVKVAGKWGYIDASGRQVIAAKFQDARSFSEDLGTVLLRDSAGAAWRVIDKTGRVVVRSRFDGPVVFSEGRAWFPTRGCWRGCIDRSGDTVIGSTFPNEDRSFSEGLAYALFRGRHGYIDKSGKVVIEANFDWGGDFHEGLAYFMDDSTAPGRWGYVGNTGGIVIKPQYGRAGDFSEGLAPVMIDGKWGYINRTGKVVIAPRFAEARSFSEGLAVAKLADVGNARYKVLRQDDGRDARGGRAESDSSGYGYIDKSGKMVIKPQFDRAGDFTDGLAEVRVTDRTPGSDILTEPPQPPPNYRDGYIDRTGNYVWRSPTQQVRDRSDRSRD